MARKTKEVSWNGDINDEIDEFEQEQEKILLHRAGLQVRAAPEEYELSDEEVLALDESEDEEMDDEQLYGKRAGDNDEAVQGWGSAKGNYYGADEIHDEEEAKREEEEALRLQKEHLKKLKVDDYFEHDDLEEWKQSAKEVDKDLIGLVEELPPEDPSLLTSKERLDFLKVSHPEVFGLISELQRYGPLVKQLRSETSPVGSVKFAALSAYVGAINMYFALFVEKSHETRAKLKDHDIMEGILKAKELWRVAEQLRDGEDLEEGDLEHPEEEELTDNQDLAEEELEEMEENEDEDEDEHEDTALFKDQVSSRKRKQASDSDSDDEFNVEIPTKSSRLHKKKKGADHDYKEAEIDEADLEDKKARKKTLRFYTSKIDQQAQRTADRYSGDADLPYRETKFEQRKRLMEEARLRGLNGNGNSAVDDFGSDDDDTKGENVTKEFEQDYYNVAKYASKQKKEERKQAHEQALQAAKQGKLTELQQQEELGEGGKRALNYQILKNKGLTQKKKKKDDRNSRVKRRKKYEKALKKLPSVRQVYKATTTAYGGETTGIKKSISRSVKFGS